MPPKQKVTKEMILEAVFKITREQGYEAVNARSIAKAIGCSTQPIFSHYTAMTDLKKDFFKYLTDYYNEYALGRVQGKIFAGDLGLAYIDFAKNEANLFKVLFMSECVGMNGFSDVLWEGNLEVVEAMSKKLNINQEGAKNILMKSWIFMHGIAAMIATKSIKLSEGEAEQMLKGAREAFLQQEKAKEEKE